LYSMAAGAGQGDRIDSYQYYPARFSMNADANTGGGGGGMGPVPVSIAPPSPIAPRWLYTGAGGSGVVIVRWVE
jgi:hypothetical protein